MVRRMIIINSNTIAIAVIAQIIEENNLYQRKVQNQRRRCVRQILVTQEKFSPFMANVKVAQISRYLQQIREVAKK